MSPMLKPPPRFVKNPQAWAYVLNKLATKQDEDGKQRLDEGGNPLNYAAAAAIYRNVVNKYGDHVPEVPAFVDAVPAASRVEALAMEARVWTVAHNSAWSANDTAHQRLYCDGSAWIVQRFEGDAETLRSLDQQAAEWLVREHPDALEFVKAGC